MKSSVISMGVLKLGWSDIESAVHDVARKIYNNGYMPDIIVAISRGGLIPARLLSDILKVKLIVTIAIEFYEDVDKTKCRPRLVYTLPKEINIAGKNVLVCDDIVDSGQTLKLTREYLESLNPKQIKFVSLLVKPHAKTWPDYYSRKTDKWVVFPWESTEFKNL